MEATKIEEEASDVIQAPDIEEESEVDLLGDEKWRVALALKGLMHQLRPGDVRDSILF